MTVTDDGYEGYEDQRWRPSDEDRQWMAEMAREYDAKPAAGLHVVDSGDGDAGAAVEHLMPRLDWSTLFAEEDEGERWILEPLLAEGRSTALYSKPKAGKSLLMLEVAVGVSRGFAVLGMKPPRPYRVLYVDFENDPQGDIRQRLEAMGYDQDLVAKGALDNLVYLSFPNISKLDTVQGGGELMQAVDHYDCDVVIIDTVSRTIGGEENDNNTWLNFYRCTGVEMKRRGVAMLRLDHSGKDADKGMRGGSAKSGDVDMVWRLTPMSETVIELECTDHRMRVDSSRLTLVREEEPNLYHRVAAGHERAGMTAKEKEVVRDIEALHLSPDRSASAIYEALKAVGKGRTKQTTMRVIRAWKQGQEGTSPSPEDQFRTDAVRNDPEPVNPEPVNETHNPRSEGVDTGSEPLRTGTVRTPIGANRPNRDPNTCPTGASDEVHRVGACDCWAPEGDAS